MNKEVTKPRLDTPILTEDEVSELLGVAKTTLRTWRSRGTGPISFKIGRSPRYYQTDVESWIKDQRRG